uniref:3'-5' exonuclease n=1 Tax=Phallusia mammillata TaxID=59560 RepID=A0A6F9DWE0_9ASCI|nr:Werner syndrome ATP-dependent helicase homolog [Phallusia mammillata]
MLERISRFFIMSRKLPPWMTNQAMCLTSEVDYPKIVLPKSCDVVYSHQIQDCALLCQEIRDSVKKSRILSLDAEWPVNFNSGSTPKIAVLQLCTTLDRAYVFHISQMGCVPDELKALLESPDFLKMGLNVKGDLWKLHRDFDNMSAKVVEHFVDLSKFAQTALNTSENWSLARLCRHVLHKDLPKDAFVRQSEWDRFPLTETQIQYAALDVYASLKIFMELKSKV